MKKYMILLLASLAFTFVACDNDTEPVSYTHLGMERQPYRIGERFLGTSFRWFHAVVG